MFGLDALYLVGDSLKGKIPGDGHERLAAASFGVFAGAVLEPARADHGLGNAAFVVYGVLDGFQDGGWRRVLGTRMAGEIGQLLKDKGQTVAVSETSAGGLVSAALLAVPGASAYYMGGGVLYTYDSRSILLGLPEDAFEGMRPSTEPYAAKLAAAIKDRLGSTWGVSETGPVEEVMTLETGSADREANMWAFAEATLGQLKEAIEKS